MKYLLNLTFFAVGTGAFLLVWFGVAQCLSALFVDSFIVDVVSFSIGLFAGWAVDYTLYYCTPARYK